jgi:glycerate kinase
MPALRPNRILIASNGHKGVLGPSAACAAIAEGLDGIDAEVRCVPMADGGDGLIEALSATLPGTVQPIVVRDALFRPRQARLALLQTAAGRTAVLEMADAAGSAMLAPHERQTMVASSYGVGEMILAAAARGCERVIVGLGGGITSDCGMGLAQALGVQFLGRDGKVLQPVCNAGFNALSLMDVDDVRLEGLRIDPGRIGIVVAADVDTPLLGPNGQAATFGPQKGASPAEIAYLERGLANVADVVRRRLGRDIDIPMAGAAGGLAAGLHGFLGAPLQLGAEVVSDALALAQKIGQSGLLIVGEGKMDRSTFHRKSPHYLAGIAATAGVPIVAVVGSLELGAACFHAIYVQEPQAGIELNGEGARRRLSMAAARLKADIVSRTPIHHE